MNAIITSGGSHVSQVTGPRCEIAVSMGPVNPGEDWTATTPGCWSGYHYQLISPGTIGVQMTLTWSGGTTGGASGSVEIYADFSLS